MRFCALAESNRFLLQNFQTMQKYMVKRGTFATTPTGCRRAWGLFLMQVAMSCDYNLVSPHNARSLLWTKYLCPLPKFIY